MIKAIDAFILKCDGCRKEYEQENVNLWKKETSAKESAELDGWHVGDDIDLCPVCYEKAEEKA